MSLDLLPRLMELQARNCLLEHLVFTSKIVLGLIVSEPEGAALVAREALARIDHLSGGRV